MTDRPESASHRRLLVAGVLALALCTAFSLSLGATADAKKKKKKTPTVFSATDNANLSIPDDQPTGNSIPVSRTLTVGKKFKGKVVGDVNVTGIRVTGSATDSADDVGLYLTAPDGTNVLLINPTGIGDQTIGPLTFDDDTNVAICDRTVPPGDPCPFYNESLNRPFAGTANLLFQGSGGTGPLSAFDGGPMKGTWRMTAWDEDDIGKTNVLNSWGLQITAKKPVK